MKASALTSRAAPLVTARGDLVIAAHGGSEAIAGRLVVSSQAPESVQEDDARRCPEMATAAAGHLVAAF